MRRENLFFLCKVLPFSSILVTNIHGIHFFTWHKDRVSYFWHASSPVFHYHTWGRRPFSAGLKGHHRHTSRAAVIVVTFVLVLSYTLVFRDALGSQQNLSGRHGDFLSAFRPHRHSLPIVSTRGVCVRGSLWGFSVVLLGHIVDGAGVSFSIDAAFKGTWSQIHTLLILKKSFWNF